MNSNYIAQDKKQSTMLYSHQPSVYYTSIRTSPTSSTTSSLGSSASSSLPESTTNPPTLTESSIHSTMELQCQWPNCWKFAKVGKYCLQHESISRMNSLNESTPSILDSCTSSSLATTSVRSSSPYKFNQSSINKNLTNISSLPYSNYSMEAQNISFNQDSSLKYNDQYSINSRNAQKMPTNKIDIYQNWRNSNNGSKITLPPLTRSRRQGLLTSTLPMILNRSTSNQLTKGIPVLNSQPIEQLHKNNHQNIPVTIESKYIPYPTIHGLSSSSFSSASNVYTPSISSDMSRSILNDRRHSSVLNRVNSMALDRLHIPKKSVQSNKELDPTVVSISPGLKQKNGVLLRGRRCHIEGCIKYALRGGRCIAHGGGKRCGKPGCETAAQSGGFCKAHGGGSRCKRIDCGKVARKGGYCIQHGGRNLCKAINCQKTAHKGGLCIAHGGGNRCMAAGCTKASQSGSLCYYHGGKQS